MTGGPISDRRLISHNNGTVTFSARTGKTTGGSDDTAAVKLSAIEFVRRWSLHILPKGYTKTRRLGGLSNYHTQRYIAACRELLPTRTTESASAAASSDPADRVIEHRCPQCETLLHCLTETDFPGWGVVMGGPYRPHWYDDD